MLSLILSGLLGIAVIVWCITTLRKNAKAKRLRDLQAGIPKPSGKLYWVSRIANWVAAIAPFVLLGIFFFGMFNSNPILGESILSYFQLLFSGVLLIEIIAFIISYKYRDQRNEELGKPRGSGGLSTPVLVGVIAIALFTLIILGQ
jgi:hypothetical protein